MVCPECGSSIREEQRYLMSASADEPPRWAKVAIRYVTLFLVLFAVFALIAHGAVS
jgi:hypothetical protein